MACLLLVAGCSDGKGVTYKSGGMTHTLSEGKDATPQGFPLPIYPGATTSGSVSAESDDQDESKFLMLSTDDSLDKVSAYYQEELRKAGWSVDMVDTQPKLVSIAAKQKDIDANVMLCEDNGKTTISLATGKVGEINVEEAERSTENFTPNKVTPPTD